MFAAPVLSALLALVAYLVACQTTFPWCDELVLADKSANWAVHGVFEGHVWPQTYNLLYPLSLSVTFRLLGVSHAAVCAFTVFAAFLASLAALSAGRRRGLLPGITGQVLFVALFWAAGNLPWIYANGRLESLTMLFSVLFVDALLPDATRGSRKSLWLSVLWGSALMLTSVYMLPMLFVLGLCALVFCGAEERPRLFRRGLACACAFAFAYLLMMAFYVWTQEAVRFAGFYIYFNTITGQAVGTLGGRIAHGYGHDVWAMVLSGAALLLALVAKKPRLLVAAAFIAAIPFLMTALGRYEAYYSWAFCLPAAFLAVALVSRRLHTGVALALAGGILIWGGFSQVRKYAATTPAREARDRADAFVSAHPELFASTADVVVAEDVYGDSSYYYPLLRCGCRLWYRGTETLTGPSDREKFRKGLSFVLQDPARQDEILDKVMAYQRCMPTLPGSAVFVFPSAKSHDDIVPLLRERGYEKNGDLAELNGIRCERWTRQAGELM